MNEQLQAWLTAQRAMVARMTPGPWEECGREVIGRYCNTIADVPRDADWEANASGIAAFASPDRVGLLLDAIEALVADREREFPNMNAKEAWQERKARRNRADAALAALLAAGGKEPASE